MMTPKGSGKSDTKEEEAEEAKWRAEQDLRTLIDAEKIKNDSERLKGAMAARAEQKKALDAIKG